jgi:peptidoglycan/LPS O-acetylase OafA/YrhL
MKHKIFFGGLNELRALAALAVIFSHLELYNFRDKVDSLFQFAPINYFITYIGKHGVYAFFVLSGFLITYLLLVEKNEKNTISLANFYRRRIFRIWPLYFIIIIISIWVLPYLTSLSSFFSNEFYYNSLFLDHTRYELKNILLYVFIFSNFASAIPGAGQTWSVSVEEQFYLIWPIWFKFFNPKKLAILFIVIIVLMLIMLKWELPLYKLFEKIPLYLMGIGGLAALAYYHYASVIKKFTSSNLLFLLIVFSIIGMTFIYVPKSIFAVFIGILILFLIDDSRKINLRNKYLFFLGTISYGLYMYHPIMMFFSSAMAHQLVSNENIVGYKILFYIFTICTTIAISWLSYTYIELKLLTLKDKKFN